jgi:hypothetical protein
MAFPLLRMVSIKKNTLLAGYAALQHLVGKVGYVIASRSRHGDRVTVIASR